MNTSLPAVIGTNYKRIRADQHGVTRETVAGHARRLGLRWSTSSVADFEAGRSESATSTVLTAMAALNDAINATGSPGTVTWADLLHTDNTVALAATFQPSGSDVAAVDVALSSYGQLTSTAVAAPQTLDVEDMRRRSDITEARAAKRLKISPDTLIELSWRLWGCTFGEERERRAASPAMRAQVSRALQAELRKAMADGNH